MKCLKDFINKTLLLIRTSTCKVILYWPKACSAAIPRTCTPARMHPHQHPQPTQPVRTQRVTHLIQQATSRPRLDPMRQFLVRNLRLMTQQPRPQKPIRLSEPLAPPSRVLGITRLQKNNTLPMHLSRRLSPIKSRTTRPDCRRDQEQMCFKG